MQITNFPLKAPYIFQKELPSGSLCKTALFQHQESGQPFICKSYRKETIGSMDKIQSFKERLDHISLIKNPYLVQYSQVVDTGEYILILREYIDCSSLAESIADNIEIDSSIVISLWKNIAYCIDNLHSHHISPNYLKPSNIFIINNSYVRITDICSPQQEIDKMVHSPNPFDIAFLAPEFFNMSAPPSHLSDYWTLGVILVFMLTKSLPWNTKNVFTMLNQINSQDISLPHSLPPEANEFVRELLQKKPENRKLKTSSISPKRVTIGEPNEPPLSPGSNFVSPRLASGRLTNAGFLILNDNRTLIRRTSPSCVGSSSNINSIILRTREIPLSPLGNESKLLKSRPTINTVSFNK